MRDLCQPRLVRRAAPAALITTTACAPYVATRDVLPAAAALAALLALTLLIWQIVFAWTPPQLHRLTSPHWPPPGRRLAAIGIGGGFAALLLLHTVDPLLAPLLPRYRPSSVAAMATALPWIAGFQPLFFIALVFAFALRLTRRTGAGVAAAVLLAEFVAYRQTTMLAAGPAAIAMAVTGAKALLFSAAYLAAGFPGVCLATGSVFARFLLGAATGGGP